jgi:S1-C subfamily serine protease
MMLVFGGAASVAEERVQSGTAFLVSANGLWLTSAHVVSGCYGVIIWPITGPGWVGQTVAIDERSDIALVLTQGEIPKRPPIAHDNGSLNPGEAVATIAFGARSSRPREPVFTSGRLIGPTTDPTGDPLLLIKARIPEGNSGAPVIDANGALLGMVTGRDAGRPKIGVVIPTKSIDVFLSRQGITPMSNLPPVSRPINTADLLRATSALVQCAPVRHS